MESLTYLPIKELLKLCYKNRFITKEFIKYLHKINSSEKSDQNELIIKSDISDFIIENPYLTLNLYYPFSKNLMELFVYIKQTKYPDTFITTKRYLPKYDVDPIPFSWSIIKENKIKYIISYLYYFEITLGKSINNYPIEISYQGINMRNNPVYNTSGFLTEEDLCQGFNQNIEGDVIGSGLIYKDRKIKFFFTINGYLIQLEKEYEYKDAIRPYIKYDKLNFKINLGEEEFLFDVEKLNNDSLIYSSSNEYLINGFQ
jgi:hypothetical protein